MAAGKTKKTDIKKEKKEKKSPVMIELSDLEIDGTTYHTILPVSFLNHKKWESIEIGDIKSLITGIVKKVFVKKGDEVKQGDCLLLLEAMKMNNEILAPISGTVKNVFVTENSNIPKGTLMVKIKPEKNPLKGKEKEAGEEW